MPATNLKTSEENVRTPIDGSEIVRLATSGANWQATLNNIFNELATASYTPSNPLTVAFGLDVTLVANNQTDQVIATGAGKFLFGLLIVPESVNPDSISFKDGSGSAMEVFNGGTGSVSSKVPFFVPINYECTTSIKITTGNGAHVIAQGFF